MSDNSNPDDHAFLSAPHKTVIALSIPALLSLVAEPLTGLVDTAFVARLGAVPLAALGVGTGALSSIFWIFSFLGIGIQTEVAQSLGGGERQRAGYMTGLALNLGVILSLAVIVLLWLGAGTLTALLGAGGAVQADASDYLRIRLFGAPAVLILLIGFGALRGMQDMRGPFFIATGVNLLNIVLDWPLIYGLAFIPALDVSGAALASVISQWTGALWVLIVLHRRLKLTPQIHLKDMLALIKIGGDLFLRTGLLTVFLLLATRVATQIGPEAGAAHQAIRQVWIFSAFVMEAFAMTAQSLVGYFVGAGRIMAARRVASLGAAWSLATAVVLAAVMLLSTNLVISALVPDEAADVFMAAWVVSALTQPLSALAFLTDGVHWGTGDYRFLRNAMLLAAVSGAAALLLIDVHAAGAFTLVWAATGVWIGVRALFGVLRVWPGLGHSPLGDAPQAGRVV